MITDEEIDVFLEHHGVKGMRWGVRSKTKTKTTPEKMSNKKKAGIILGSAAGVAAIAAGAFLAKKHLGVSASNLGTPSDSVKKFTKSMAEEPTSIMHASRGKNRGWGFPQHGGLESPLTEYLKVGFDRDDSDTIFKRYGDNNEKIAARFHDPEGRKDFAGRGIKHDVFLPKEMSKNVNSLDDVINVSWPLIKDKFDAFYNSRGG